MSPSPGDDPYGAWVEGYWAPRAFYTSRYVECGYYRSYGRDNESDHDYGRFERDDDRREFRGRGHAYGRRRGRD